MKLFLYYLKLKFYILDRNEFYFLQTIANKNNYSITVDQMD